MSGGHLRALPRGSLFYNFNIDDYVAYGILPVLTAKENLRYLAIDIKMDLNAENYNQISESDIEGVAKWKADSLKNDVMALEGKERENAYAANTQDFKRLLDYCIKEKYRPVIIMTPVTENLKIELSYDLIEEFYQMTQQILLEYKDIPLLDYSRDEEFTKNLKYYRDADHLNAYGKERYTKKVLKDLAKLNLIDKAQIRNEG